MLGLERFLKRCPEWAGKIVLIQVGISAYEREQDYERTRKEVPAMVKRINDAFPGTVQFQECAESEMRLQQRMALLRAADVVLVTPIRDGLNLIPLVSCCRMLKNPYESFWSLVFVFIEFPSYSFLCRNSQLPTRTRCPQRENKMAVDVVCVFFQSFRAVRV